MTRQLMEEERDGLNAIYTEIDEMVETPRVEGDALQKTSNWR
jgi:hypothetical protein